MGTVRFMAPECFNSAPDKELHGKRVDIWAAGITLFLLLTKEYPFVGQTLSDIIDSITGSEPPLHKIDNKDIRELLGKILEKDPTKRLQAIEIV